MKKIVEISAKIPLIHFVDEHKVHNVYCPVLDINGYGKNRKEALKSFDIMLKEFWKYTLENDTIDEELEKLGWNKKSNKVEVPILPDSLLSNNDFINFINSRSSFDYLQKDVNIPVCK